MITGNENGQRTWTLAGRTYTSYPEFVRAQDRRVAEFLRRCGGKPVADDNPNRFVPEWATPENFDPQPEWPIAECIDEALDNRFRLLSAAQLNSSERTTRYLIPGILAAGQPGGIYGAAKTLKTSLAADLMISLASGTPFLGRFPVSKPGRVLFLSGESGLDALQSVARRICRERGLSLESLDNLVISPDLPRLDRPVDLMALRELIEREKPVCLVIDPIYLAMDSSKSRNLFAMGAMLRPLAELCESTGCAVLVVHHAKRSHKMGSPPTLEDIAWSGFAEFSAQWLLVSRRRPFETETGHHELWLSSGGRSGQHGLWALDVDEGALSPVPEDGPILPTSEDQRTWKVVLKSVSLAEAQADEHFVATSADRQLRRRAMATERQSHRVLELLAAYPDGCKARFIRDVLGLSGDRMSRLLDALVKQGVVEVDERFDGRRTVATYSRVPRPMDLSQAACEARRATGPDRKVYDIGTGQFVDRKKSRVFELSSLGRLNPEEVGQAEASSIAASSAPDPTGAGASPVPPGRDTSVDREKSRDLAPGGDAEQSELPRE
ncbi:MAG TPA: AAA family ATPase [Planctomycetaceae bacterium]|nr:AAA family ATPase [Planctomycetaceae bacterium]